MHNVCDEIVDGVLVHCLHFLREVFPEIYVPAAEKPPSRLCGPDPSPPAKALQGSGIGFRGQNASDMLTLSQHESPCH